MRRKSAQYQVFDFPFCYCCYCFSLDDAFDAKSIFLNTSFCWAWEKCVNEIRVLDFVVFFGTDEGEGIWVKDFED